MNLKKTIGTLHLWLGLASGLVVFVVAITGCLYAFKTEIEDSTQAYRYVPAQARPVLSPSRLGAIGRKTLPGNALHSVTYRTGRAAILAYYQFDPAYYYLAFVNPYSGEVLKVQDMDRDFFYQVLQGHYYLWLPPAIGQPIVAYSTLMFVVLLLTGFVLWWPRNRAARKQRFSVKWKVAWRRRNYDLHNVMGFYVLSAGLLLAMTGLIWGFEWFARSVYWATSGGKELVTYYEPQSGQPSAGATAAEPAIDRLWRRTLTAQPRAITVEVHYPATPTATIAISTNPDADTYWQSEHRYYDQYSLKEIPVRHLYGRFDQTLSVADKIARLNYDVHVGAIGGLPGKVLAFGASLIIASLPVTGFLIWWGRQRKAKPTTRPAKREQTGQLAVDVSSDN